MVCIKHSSKDMHPCILLAYCITSHGVYQAFIKTHASLHTVSILYHITWCVSSIHQNMCILVYFCIWITSNLSMHHSPCIAQKCITFVALSLHHVMPYVYIASSVCISLMHLVCCISLVTITAFTQLRVL